MAKKNGTLKIVGLLITVILIVGGLIADYVLQGEAIADNTEDIIEIKVGGCNVANAVDRRVLVLETKWDAVLEGQKEILKAVKKRL